MKKLLLVLVVVVGILVAAAAYEQLVVQKTFGPSGLVALAMVGGVFLSVLVTFLLYDTRHRELTGKIWLTTLSTVGSFLLLDLIVGFFLIRPLSPALVPDEHRHHKLVPNSYSKIEQQDFSYTQRVNNLGIRGRDVSIEKPQNSYRILMLGDSFTMGKGVEDDQTFSVVLEKLLNEKSAACSGKAFEVLNGGVDSYSPILELIQLTRDLRQMQPDLIVLNLDVSDLVQETVYRRQAVYGPGGDIVAVPRSGNKVSLTESVRTWTEAHMFFTRALLYYVNELFAYKDLTLRNVLTQADAEIAAHTLAQDSVSRDEQWRAIFDSLSRIKRYSDGKGIQFMLSVYPWPHQVSDKEWIPGRYTFIPKGAVPSDKSLNTIQELAARNDIQLLNLFPAFHAYHGTNELYFRHDMHWTAAGHQVMAAGLADLLESRYRDRWCR